MKVALFLVLLILAGPARPLAAADSYAQLRADFAKPPAAYSTAPFMVWNGEVTEAEIDKHLESFHAQGVQAVIIHPRPGLITPYLSERWFALCRYAVDKGKRLGMEVWLYDENSYPSGFAGGHVPAEMPESYNEGQGLIPRKISAPDPKCRVLLKKAGESWVEATADSGSEKGEYYCFDLAYYNKRAWHGGFSYVDLIRPGVTEKFIEITMRGYERALGADLGHAVPGIFTDEPNIAPPPGKNCLRWTPDLFARFQERWGYDLKTNLPSLLEQTGDWRKVRHDYYALLLELFIDRWSKPWYAYATAHRIQWTGHYWEHGWPSPAQGPDNMAMYAWHQVPAIDMLFNQFREDVNAQFGNVRSVKELASVANQMGRRRTLSETYGGAGWELRFEDMKRLGDWQYALGVNLMNQHLAFETLAGARKYDYPQSFTYHEPWWNQYHALADYYTRLSLALATGAQVNRVLVLEPTSSAWLYAPGSPARMMEIGRTFQEFVTRLEAQQVEYDLGSENIIKDYGKVEWGRFVVGQRAYDLVVLPPGIENLDAPTVRLLAQYLSSGGKIVSLVEPPGRIDGAVSDRMTRLAASYPAQWLKTDALPSGSEFKWSGGKLFHHRRQLSDGQVLFLVNSSLEEATRGTLEVNGKSVDRLDPFTGEIRPYPAQPANGGLTLHFDLPPAGSLLLFTRADGTPAKATLPAAERAVASAEPMTVRRLTPNTLQIDYCDLKLGDTLQKELYFFNAADKVFRFHGLDGNPWNTAVQYKTAILDKNHFAPDSGFEAAFHFDVDGGVDRAGLQAVVERPVLWKVAVNGKPVESRPNEWWLDRAFGVYDIGQHAVAGRNTVTLTARPMSVHHELEPIYILGDFGLASQSSGWKLVPATPLQSGPWKAQGLPFYSNTVSYSRDYRLDGHAKVRLGKWLGTVAEVKVNGVSAGIIGWQPYELDISSLVRPGVNRIEVIVYGSLKNLLGPHHGKINRGLTSPGSFRSAPATMPPGETYDLEAYGLSEDFQVLQMAPVPH